MSEGKTTTKGNRQLYFIFSIASICFVLFCFVCILVGNQSEVFATFVVPNGNCVWFMFVFR